MGTSRCLGKIWLSRSGAKVVLERHTPVPRGIKDDYQTLLKSGVCWDPEASPYSTIKA